MKRTDFRDLIANSEQRVQQEREAKDMGDLSSASEEEFFEKFKSRPNKKREIKKEMDKDDFLKL